MKKAKTFKMLSLNVAVRVATGYGVDGRRAGVGIPADAIFCPLDVV
jgi:hypothetical protein